MKQHIIKAVHEQDLTKLLDALDLTPMLEQGELKCGICECVVDLQNLLCIYPEDEDIKVCCKKRECYEELLKHRQL